MSLLEVSGLEIVRAGQWRSALFTTYALSLGFFEGAVLPSLQRSGARDITIFSDIEGVAGALSEAGARHVGRAYSVVPVRNSAGVFHPKLTALAGPDGPQLLVGSGNLTFGGWGRNIELFEYLIPVAQPAAFNDAARFLSGLCSTPRLSLSSDAMLVEHARVLETAGGDAVEGAVRILHNLEQGIAGQITAFVDAYGGAERLTVASPYFGNIGAVRALAEQLGLDGYEVHVARNIAVNGEHFQFDQAGEAKPVILEVLDQGAGGSRPLHAKLIEIVCARARLIVSGSVNASRPSLSAADNVELAVLRIVENRQCFARIAHQGPLPPIEARSVSELGKIGSGVLTASYVGGVLEGKLLVANPGGLWHVQLDIGGERQNLGKTEVDGAGVFMLETEALESGLYRTQRTTLIFRRDEREARGFVCFQDILTASRRLGGVAGPLLSIASGSDNDADWISFLEWFAKNPQQTASGWSSNRQKAEPKVLGDETVAIAALTPRADQTSAVAQQTSSQAAGTLQRLLGRLRLVLRSPSAKAGSWTDAEEDDPGRKAPKGPPAMTKRLSSAFDRVVEVLSERVPSDPSLELKRLGEIGIFMLLRHVDEPERMTQFLRHWFELALKHLPQEEMDEELCDLALGMTSLSSAFDKNAKRGRRQLLDLLGAENERVFGVEANDVAVRFPAIQTLARQSVGESAWQSALHEVRHVKISLDDVRAFRAALDGGYPVPDQPTLSTNPNLARALELQTRQRTDLIHRGNRTSKSCPRCNQTLPTAGLEEFKSTGITRTECCNGVLLRSDV